MNTMTPATAALLSSATNNYTASVAFANDELAQADVFAATLTGGAYWDFREEALTLCQARVDDARKVYHAACEIIFHA